MDTHLGADGTRLKQNYQAMLIKKPMEKYILPGSLDNRGYYRSKIFSKCHLDNNYEILLFIIQENHNKLVDR